MITNNWILLSVAFLTYFFVSWFYKRLEVTNLEKALLIRNGLRLLNLKHSLGIVLFGVLFYTLLPKFRSLVESVEIARLHLLIPFILLTFICAYISLLSSKTALKKDDGLSHYRFSDAWGYFIIRFIFLLCYEFFFRGVMLVMFLECFGITAAIAYSTILYFIIHLFDSKKELLATIPFGMLLCVLTYYTNSIWYAFLMHLTLSAVYEISIFYYKTLKPLNS